MTLVPVWSAALRHKFHAPVSVLPTTISFGFLGLLWKLFELDTALTILSRCIARRWLKEPKQTDKEPCRNRGIGWLLAICNGHSFSLLRCIYWHCLLLDPFLKKIHPSVYLKYYPFLATLCSLLTLSDALEARVFVEPLALHAALLASWSFSRCPQWVSLPGPS